MFLFAHSGLFAGFGTEPRNLQFHVSFLRSAACLRFLFQRFVPPVRFNEDFFRLQFLVKADFGYSRLLPFQLLPRVSFFRHSPLSAFFGFSRLLEFGWYVAVCSPVRVISLITAGLSAFKHQKAVGIWGSQKNVGFWKPFSEECWLFLVQKPLLPFQTQKIVGFLPSVDYCGLAFLASSIACFSSFIFFFGILLENTSISMKDSKSADSGKPTSLL